MTRAFEQLKIDCQEFGVVPNLEELIYSSATKWSDWQNHVPFAVQAVWRELEPEARLAVYLTARAVTVYTSLRVVRAQRDELLAACEAMYERHPGCSCDEGDDAPGNCPSCLAKMAVSNARTQQGELEETDE